MFDGESVRVGGDAIVAIDGLPVRSAEDVVRIVTERLLPGETAAFTVVRGRHRLSRAGQAGRAAEPGRLAPRQDTAGAAANRQTSRQENPAESPRFVYPVRPGKVQQVWVCSTRSRSAWFG